MLESFALLSMEGVDLTESVFNEGGFVADDGNRAATFAEEREKEGTPMV
jgi:hypothetical protein